MFDRIKSSAGFTYAVFLAAAQEYGTDRVSRMSAAVAYRTLFAVTPLFIISVGALGLFLGSNQEAQDEIYSVIERVAGSEIATAMETFLGTAVSASGSVTLVGFVLLLWTTSSLFHEVQNDLNDIFHVPYERTAGLFGTIRKRGVGFLWSLGIGLLVLSIWVVNVAWGLMNQWFLDRDLERLHQVISALTPLVTLLLLPFLFGLLYQTLTAVRIQRRSLLYGSVFSSIGFVAAAWGTSLYFRWESDTSAATVAGAFFVVILVAYVLAGVFLFGGVLMKVGHDYINDGDVMAPSERDEEELSEVLSQRTVVAEPIQPVPAAAVTAFLAGLFVGWRRSKK